MKNNNKRLSDKSKLIYAWKNLDKLSINLHNINIHKYWEGTLIFSGIELAIRLSNDKSCSNKQNLYRYLDFMRIDDVSKAYKDFKPSIGIKSLPFWWIKILGATSFFYLCKIIPRYILKKVS